MLGKKEEKKGERRGEIREIDASLLRTREQSQNSHMDMFVGCARTWAENSGNGIIVWVLYLVQPPQCYLRRGYPVRVANAADNTIPEHFHRAGS